MSFSLLEQHCLFVFPGQIFPKLIIKIPLNTNVNFIKIWSIRVDHRTQCSEISLTLKFVVIAFKVETIHCGHYELYYSTYLTDRCECSHSELSASNQITYRCYLLICTVSQCFLFFSLHREKYWMDLTLPRVPEPAGGSGSSDAVSVWKSHWNQTSVSQSDELQAPNTWPQHQGKETLIKVWL